jgi:hypothetical protein
MRWSFQWGKVGAGAAMLLVGGGISAVLWFSGGYINRWAAGTAIVGLFTMLAGLIGEEGIW